MPETLEVVEITHESPKERREPVRLSATRGSESVDRENHVIRGIVVAELGIAKDRRLEVDSEFLDQVVTLGNQVGKGLRARFDHPSASGTSMGTLVGRARNFRKDGDRVRADLHLLNVAANSPNMGDMRTYIEDLADEDSDAFGMSLVLTKAKEIWRRTDEGDFQRDSEGQVLPPYWRIKKLWAVDVVDEPNITSGMLAIDTPAGKAAAFLDRYLESKGVRFAACGDESETEKETQTMTKQVKEADPTQAAQTAAPGPGATATADPPAPTSPPPESTATQSQLTDAQIKALKVAEGKRRDEILASAKHLGVENHPRVAEMLSNPDVTADAAASKLIELHASVPTNAPIQLVADATDKFRTVAADALLLRAGGAFTQGIEGQRLLDARDMRGYSLLRLAEECVRRTGLSRPPGDKFELVGLAMASTSDFPYLLSNVANKSMLRGYAVEPETWSSWCTMGTFSDFKQFTRLRISEADNLILNPQGTEYQDSSLDEAKQVGQAYTYGRLFSATRHTIINDDLQQLTKQPMRFGQSARRLIGDLVYAVLIGDTGMGALMTDGSYLFIDTVGGTVAGANWFDSADVPTYTSVLDKTNGEAAIQHANLLMRKQTGLKGLDNLSLKIATLLVPPELEVMARIHMQSVANVVATYSAGVINPWQGMANIEVENRLSNTGFNSNASTTGWYGVADRNVIDTIEVAFLDGRSEPYLEEQPGFKIDGITYKVRHDVAVTPLERKSLVKSKGA